MIMIMRPSVVCAALFGASTAFAQQYPSKPVKIVVPFPAGGVTDIAARLIAQKLSEKLGQQFYVENIAGAGGNLGMGQVARAAGDGYTVLFASSSIVVNPSLYVKVPFDLDKDFIPVTKAGASPNAWIVNPNFPAKTMKEMVDLIKKRARQIQRRVARRGHHAVAVDRDAQAQAEARLRHRAVHRRRADDPIAARRTHPDHLRRHRQHLGADQGRQDAGAGDRRQRRLSVLPDVPTLDEVGIKDQEAETMTGVFVPAGTPKEIVDKLQQEISAIVKSPEISARLLELGIVPEGDSSGRLRQLRQGRDRQMEER